MNFKEFLEKEKFKTRDSPYGHEEHAVSVRALGEWAIEEIFEHMEIQKDLSLDFEKKRIIKKYFDKFWWAHHTQKARFRDIADACLGEAEVKKRLEAVK